MNKVLLGAFFLLLVFPLSVTAQQTDYPPVEVFGGYSYLRANPEGFNLNGWNASFTGNLTNWFGIKGDFSGHYGSPSDQFGTIPGVDINQHTFMAGPKLAYRTRTFTPYAHFLIGAARAGTSIDDFDSTSSWALATILGGGLDLNLSRSVALRLGQADWLMTRFDAGNDDQQNNFRFSAGIVFKLGTR